MRIVKKTYNLNGNVKTKIVLISDIHYYEKSEIKDLNKLLDEIKEIRPNFICIPGDLIDEANILDEDYLINWLKDLSKISKVIISLGNHDFYQDKSKNIFNLNNTLMKKIKRINNLFLLDNENIIIDNINFIGLTIPFQHFYDDTNIDSCIKKLKTYTGYYNVLLCHSPNKICESKILNEKNIDLVLCGHMHGGVTPNILKKFLKGRGLISPNLKLFPKYSYGHLKVDNKDIIISSGVLVVSHLNKFRIMKKLFSSEIVILNVNE